MEIDQGAPMSAQKETLIAAPPEKVWTMLTEIGRWPEWQPDVSSAEIEGDLAVGTTFRWKANGLSIRSTIRALEPGRRIGWTGRSLGTRAIHIWTLEPQDGGTRVSTEESLSGWFPRILKIFDADFLDKSLTNSLQVLKAEVERR